MRAFRLLDRLVHPLVVELDAFPLCAPPAVPVGDLEGAGVGRLLREHFAAYSVA
jgi:hypothetical protein